MRNTKKTRQVLLRTAIVICSLVLLASCGSTSSPSASSSSSASPSSSLNQIAGVTATGALGKQPKISFRPPMTVQNNTYAVLQQGDGAVVSDGDRVCTQGIALNAKNGAELMNTWTKNTPDCSMVISKSATNSSYYSVLKGQKLNSTIAFGVNDQNTSGTSYILALTLISKSKAITRAEGDNVTNIPANLPKVTLNASGKPSLNINGYKPNGKLVAQTLIKGKGKTVPSSSTVSANYTGWTVDAQGKPKQFDSSWDRGSSSSFSLNQVVSGWKKGLAGQTVGSQVLLVIPPSEGYGAQPQTDSNGNVTIPANSTLYFVVDILYAA